ncbi:MAG: cache domain-containing protein [Desulfoferrobacter sp.]
MKRVTLTCLVLLIGIFVATVALAAADKAAIQKQVDEIVAAIDGGKTAADFKDAAKSEPHYVFIMQEDGILLVHPSLEGQNLKEKAEVAYNAVVKATPEGSWVEYEWKGKMKHTYVKKTNTGLIVGSGY